MLTDEELKLWDESQINKAKERWVHNYIYRGGSGCFVIDRTNYLKFAPCPILDLEYFIRMSDRPVRLDISEPNWEMKLDVQRLSVILDYFEENPLKARRAAAPNPPLRLFLDAIKSRGFYPFFLKDAQGNPIVFYHRKPTLETAEKNKLFRLLAPMLEIRRELQTSNEPLEERLARLVGQGRLSQGDADRMVATFGTQPGVEPETPATE